MLLLTPIRCSYKCLFRIVRSVVTKTEWVFQQLRRLIWLCKGFKCRSEQQLPARVLRWASVKQTTKRSLSKEIDIERNFTFHQHFHTLTSLTTPSLLRGKLRSGVSAPSAYAIKGSFLACCCGSDSPPLKDRNKREYFELQSTENQAIWLWSRVC